MGYMGQITLRVPDDLLERIEERTGPETSRSEWLREAARARLVQDENDDLRERLDEMEKRVDRLEREMNRPVWERIFK
jgi:metal-responsive CopG/Arc/MetJ family transcriptional regulator